MLFLTVHGFRVHLKPSCHSLARLPKYYGGKVRRVGLNLGFMGYDLPRQCRVTAGGRTYENRKIGGYLIIVVAQGLTHKVYERKLTRLG